MQNVEIQLVFKFVQLFSSWQGFGVVSLPSSPWGFGRPLRLIGEAA